MGHVRTSWDKSGQVGTSRDNVYQLYLLGKVPQVLGSVEVAFDEHDRKVFSIADASRQHMDTASAARPGRVNEVLIPVAPWYVASARQLMKTNCFVQQMHYVMLPMRLVVDLAINGEGDLVHTDQVLQPICRLVPHPIRPGDPPHCMERCQLARLLRRLLWVVSQPFYCTVG